MSANTDSPHQTLDLDQQPTCTQVPLPQQPLKCSPPQDIVLVSPEQSEKFVVFSQLEASSSHSSLSTSTSFSNPPTNLDQLRNELGPPPTRHESSHGAILKGPESKVFDESVERSQLISEADDFSDLARVSTWYVPEDPNGRFINHPLPGWYYLHPKFIMFYSNIV
jgi:hypothetical protein